MDKRKELLATVWTDSVTWEKYLSSILPWFNVSKIEKDFYLTIILHYIAQHEKHLIFKWWTCLNKCHFWYYRLSEDLDFSIISEINRNKRKDELQALIKRLNVFLLSLWMKEDAVSKWDEHRLCRAVWKYTSRLNWTQETIQFDVKYISWYETEIVARTIESPFTHPLTDQNIFSEETIVCISLEEAMAEKMRAALTRSEPAIRDMYDIYHARTKWFDFHGITELINLKVREVWWKSRFLENYDIFQRQIETDLEPVLWINMTFDFDETYNFILWFSS